MDFEESAMHSVDSNQMVSLEPLEIGFEPTLILPSSAKEGSNKDTRGIRRALILPSRGSSR